MNRRVVSISVVALAGLLVGAWLAMGSSPDPAPAPTARVPARPAPAPADTGAEPDGPSPGGEELPPALPVQAAHARPAEAYPLDELGPMGRVRCDLSGPTPEQLALYVIPDLEQVSSAVEGGLDPARLRETVSRPLSYRQRGDVIELDLPVGSRFVTTEVQQAGRLWRDAVDLAWDGDEGRCTTPIVLSVPVALTVAGRLDGVLDDDRVWVDVCGHRSFLRRGERRFEVQVELKSDTPCLVHAARADGAIYARSDMVEIDPADGDVRDLVLTMPEVDVGGIGVPVAPHPDGMRIGPPTPGTPAAEAGLEAGDVIVAVDGTAVAGWDLYEIIGIVTGEVGSEVELTVRTAAGELETVQLQRAWVDPKDG